MTKEKATQVNMPAMDRYTEYGILLDLSSLVSSIFWLVYAFFMEYANEWIRKRPC